MNAILLDPTLHRLGLTLLHALWEDALIGLVVWAGLALLRRDDARFRYRWASSGLAAMVLVPWMTFLALASSGAGSIPMQREDLTIWASPVQVQATLVSARFYGVLPWLAILWVAGSAIRLLRLGGGLWWLDHIYLKQSRPAPESWNARFRVLAQRMGVSRGARLLVSDRARSPLAMGWLKPVVILPASALLALSPESLEAVLAHELAHLRRGDYLANLLQTLAEALLFFHPAAWWLSRQIREIREHCCDDAAAALLGDPMPLAEGLAALAALRRPPSDPEPALAAARGTLMHRITRLFQPRPAHVSSLRGITFLIAGVTLFGATALAARQPPANRQAPIHDFDSSKIRLAYRPNPPAYPAEAKAKGITGTVVVEVTVGTEGRVESAKAVSGPEPLQATAVDYARGWRFEPARVNGKPVQARFRLTMPFRLHQDATAVHDFPFDQIQVTYRPDPPAYPAEAKAKGITGTVIVEVLVDRDGRVESAKAIEGPEELRATAVAYASAWKFKPAVLDGKPVQARFKLTMPFRLH